MNFAKRTGNSTLSNEIDTDFFKNVPLHCTIFRIWKIEDLQVINIPIDKMGIFQSECAYIIYAVSLKNGSLPYAGMPTQDSKDKPIVSAIHFWIGSACNVNDSAAAALRAVELDSQVAATIIMREAQGRESSRFLSYFRKYIIIENFHLDKSISTIHKVSGIFVPILMELESIDWRNISSQDVILIDIHSRNILFLWVGSSANSLDKRHAAIFLELKRKNNKSRIIVVKDGYEQNLPREDKLIFDSILDQTTRIAAPYHENSIFIPSPIKLYKCNEQSCKYKIVELKSGPILRSDLTSNAVFLIDRGEVGVWIWIGRNVNDRETLEAMRNARGFIKKKNYSNDVPIARVSEGCEPIEMKSLIRGWEFCKKRLFILPQKFNLDYMKDRLKMAAECQLVDDGSGEKTLWKIDLKENGGIIETANNGIYYAEVCYILRYKYGQGRKCKTIIYCWNGIHSAESDRAMAIDIACDLAEKENAQLVVAYQGREPPHLLQIYNGTLKILAGPFRNSPPQKYLLRVSGSTTYTSKAVERFLSATSLDSNGVFILFSDSPFVWYGSKSTGDTRQASQRFTPKNATLIIEGKENTEFWAQLGGYRFYDTKVIDTLEEIWKKHLYQCYTKEQIFTGKEILGFEQKSLLPETIWLLDSGTVIWIWIGKYVVLKSLKKCIKDATIFLNTHPAGRDRDTVISVIKQGLEPCTFTGLFNNWNNNLLRDYKTFEALYILSSNKQLDITATTTSKHMINFDNYAKYPLIILRNDPEKLPEDVDVAHKEMHLTFDDFIAVFQIQPVEFSKLPSWKKQRLKQSVGLF